MPGAADANGVGRRRIGLGHFDELIEHGARQTRLKTVSNHDVRSRFARFGLHDAQRMGVVQRNNVIHIGAEFEDLIGTGVLNDQLNRDKGRVLDFDLAVFHRRGQPKHAVFITAKHRGEQFHQGGTANGRAAIEPGSVAGDPHLEIAQIGGKLEGARGSLRGLTGLRIRFIWGRRWSHTRPEHECAV